MVNMRMARKSEMNHKIKVYKQVNVMDKNTGEIKQVWLYDFFVWCRVKPIFREQLEAITNGVQTYRKRLEMETTYTKKSASINATNRIVYDGDQYTVSISGDTSGANKRVRFLAERIEDGGA